MNHKYVGKTIVYEHKNGTGFRYTCKVVAFEDGWCRDERAGTCFSASFRPEDVVVWGETKH